MQSTELEIVVATAGGDLAAVASTLESIPARTERVAVTLIVDAGQKVAAEALARSRRNTTVVVTSDATTVDAWNRALERTVAPALMFLVPGTRFVEGGVEMACELAGSAAVVGYGDHVDVHFDGSREVLHKPAWSPDRFRCMNYLGPAVVLSVAELGQVGGFRREAEPELLYDAVLRMVGDGGSVAHLPRLIVESPARPRMARVTASIVSDHLTATGRPFSPHWQDADHPLLMQPALAEEPSVSIIVPTIGTTAVIDGEERVLVVTALQSVVDRTDYEAFEIVVVLDANSPDGLQHDLEAIDPRIRCLSNDRPFSFSQACNLGAAHTTGEIIVLLNDDTEVTDSSWLQHLVMHLADDGVGAVGLKLLFEDGTIQHAGLLGRHGTVRHRYLASPTSAEGYLNYLDSVVDVAAVTGACLAVRSSDYDLVGGLSLEFPLNYNDIDLCMKLRKAGLRIVVDNQVTMRHFESLTRLSGLEPWEDRSAQARWNAWLRWDPYDNPNFDMVGYTDEPVAVQTVATAAEAWRIREL